MVGFFVANAINRADGTTAVPVENCKSQKEAEALAYIRAGQTLQKVESGEYLSGAVIAFSADGFRFFSKGWVKEMPDQNQNNE